MPSAPIAVYGATGYTGRLVCAELARRGLPFVISGRSAGKLEALAREHGLAPDAVRPAAVDDPAALRAALDGCAAVIACAGPFLQVGEPVVRAAIAADCHYVDTTGETPFIQRVLEVHGPAAQAAGVALVPGMGFDYLPGDLACALAAEGAGPLEEMVVAYAVAHFGATRGTTRSALLMLGAADWRQPLRRRFAFGGAIGTRPVSNYPSGEPVTVPRHVDVARVTPLLTTGTVMPVRRLEAVAPLLTVPLALALRSARLRGALDRAIDRLPEGPDPAARRRATWTIVAEAHPRGGGPARRVTVAGSDIYGITAVTTVHAAALMAADGYDRAGGLAPAQAYDARAFLDALAPHGVTVAA